MQHSNNFKLQDLQQNNISESKIIQLKKTYKYPFLNRHEFKVWNYTFHKYIYFRMLLSSGRVSSLHWQMACVSEWRLPTITKDSQQQDDVTTLPTRCAIPSFTATTDMNTIMKAKCPVCTRSLFYLTTTIMCQFLLLLYPTYEQASQWAHVNMTNKPRGSDNR
jgi:hypothetical protein